MHYIGSHVSIRKGYLGAAKTALHIGAKAFQFFPKNPRSLSIKAFDKRDAEACKQFCQEHNLLSIAHSPYPTNIATDDEMQRELIVQSMLNDLHIVEACGSTGLVVHFGKYNGKEPLQGYKNSLQCLNDVLSQWKGQALLLIENQAGEGTRMGISIEEFMQIRKLSQYPEKIGFCLDTCHAYASGLWNDSNWPEVMSKAEELGYSSHLIAVHLNDSMFPSGSMRDRHANIGRGFIGERGMRQFLQTPWLQDIPLILETPTASDYTHRQELIYVDELLKKRG